MYDERIVTPMRQELTRLGVEEMRTPDEVDAKLKDSKGTTLVVVNSVCGCAARNARPAVARRALVSQVFSADGGWAGPQPRRGVASLHEMRGRVDRLGNPPKI